jgi:lysophospholipase L1-like esterase
MANKVLKSIKFPGLNDTYTIPQVDSTLAVSGAAADAKKTGDAIGDLKSAFDQTNCWGTSTPNATLNSVITSIRLYGADEATGYGLPVVSINVPNGTANIELYKWNGSSWGTRTAQYQVASGFTADNTIILLEEKNGSGVYAEVHLALKSNTVISLSGLAFNTCQISKWCYAAMNPYQLKYSRIWDGDAVNKDLAAFVSDIKLYGADVTKQYALRVVTANASTGAANIEIYPWDGASWGSRVAQYQVASGFGVGNTVVYLDERNDSGITAELHLNVTSSTNVYLPNLAYTVCGINKYCYQNVNPYSLSVWSASTNKTLANVVTDIRLYGADESEQYGIPVFQVNASSGTANIELYKWNGSSWSPRVAQYQVASGFTADNIIVYLNEVYGSGVSAELHLSLKSNTTISLVNLPFDACKIKKQCYEAVNPYQIGDGVRVYGKTVYNFGDSIAAGDGNSNIGYGELLQSMFGATTTDYAISGATMSKVEGQTFACILDEIDNASSTIPDIVLLEGATNDYLKYRAMGTVSAQTDFSGEWDTETYIGALETALYKLQTKYPGAVIVWVYTHRCHLTEQTGGGVTVNFNTMHDLSMDVCKKWAIPVVDLYNECGLNTNWTAYRNTYTMNGDRVHPNLAGYKRFYMPLIVAKLNDVIPYD